MISDKHITTPHERVKVTSVTWLPRSNSWIRLLKFILQASSSFRVARERASEREAQPRGASSRVSFRVLLLRDLSRYPQNEEFPRSLSHCICLLFRLLLFFWTRFWERARVTEPYFVKRILGSFRAVRNATYTATPKEKTRSVTYTQTRTLPVRDIERVMIFLNPRGGKIKRIMRFDWLPEHLAASGYPALVLQDKVLVIGLDLLCVLLTST